MSFRDEGFLSPDIGLAITNIRARHAKWFEFSTRLSRLCQQSLMAAIPADELRQLVGCALFQRCVSGFQGVIILAERGLFLEARCLTRVILEATFTLTAIENDPTFVEAFVDGYEVDKKKRIAKFLYVSGAIAFPPEMVERIRQEQVNVLAEIGARGIKGLTTKDIAERAGMLAHYHTVYSLLSDSVHNTVRDLERHYIFDANGRIVDIRWAPGVEEMDEVIGAACDTMFTALANTMNVFGQEALRTQYDALFGEWTALRKALD